jgi:hypothetical protein
MISNFKYEIRCFFFPYNVVKVKKCPRTWTDRDSLMFHAVFQILVDFIELEQPFREYGAPRIKRQTDISEMIAFNEKYHNTEYGYELNYYPGIDDADKKACDKVTKQHYNLNREMLYLYEWYQTKKYEFDYSRHFKGVGETLEFSDHGIVQVDTGDTKIITWNEFSELEEDHDVICDAMLKRVISIRDYLWT